MEDLSLTCVMLQLMRLMMRDQWKTSASPVWCHSQWDWWCLGPMEDLSFTCVMPQPMRLMMPAANGRPQLHVCDATANRTYDARDQWKTSASPVLCHSQWDWWCLGPMEDLSFTCVMPQPMRLMMPGANGRPQIHVCDATANRTYDAWDQWKTSASPVWCHSQWDWWCQTNRRPQLHLCDATANETDDAGPMEGLSFTCVMPQPMRLIMPDQWKTSAK